MAGGGGGGGDNEGMTTSSSFQSSERTRGMTTRGRQRFSKICFYQSLGARRFFIMF